MPNYKQIRTQLLQFRDERDWKQFHDSNQFANEESAENVLNQYRTNH